MLKKKNKSDFLYRKVAANVVLAIVGVIRKPGKSGVKYDNSDLGKYGFDGGEYAELRVHEDNMLSISINNMSIAINVDNLKDIIKKLK